MTSLDRIRTSADRRAALVFFLLTLTITSHAAAQKPQVRLVRTVRAASASTPAHLEFSKRLLSRLHVPAGFRVSVFAEGLGSPRMLAVEDDGTVLVTRRDSSDVIALTPGADGRAGPPRTVVSNLPRVHGIALHQGKIYLATVKEVYAGDLKPEGAVGDLRPIITDLPDGGQHANRTLGVGPDGMLYITVGSTCNQCVEPNEENATILRATLDGRHRGVYARGLRNTIGFGWRPGTGEFWGMDHGWDWKGDDTPPDELNRLQPAFYGWPYCYGRKLVDSSFSSDPPGSTKDEACARSVAPVVQYQAHSAPIQMAFYTADSFPRAYRGDAFIAMRGSWNRKQPTGYKVVRIRFGPSNTARIEDFLTGFLTPGGQYFGRPAGLAVAKDGSLLLSDDTNGVIYRIAYEGAGAARAGGR